MKAFFIIIIFWGAVICSNAQKAEIIKSPGNIPADDGRLKIFLGGSIDMGNTENWQNNIEKELEQYNVVLLNPRRNDWNKDWKPVSSDTNFRKQVLWELNALEASDIIIMYFAPGSQSPVSLLEYGLYARTGKLMVVCPDGFWRKGNVDIVSERYDIKTFGTMAELIETLKSRIAGHK